MIGTDDPAIEPGLASPAVCLGHPDEIMSIETSRIHGTTQPLGPTLLLVPIETDRTGGNRSQGKQNGQKSGDGAKKPDQNKQDATGNQKQQRQNRQPPLWRMLLYSAGISLLCSIIVAGAMVYFFSGSSDQQSSGKSSGSGKGSEKDESKSEGPKSGQGSDSGEESGSGESSDSSKNSEPGQSPKKKSESTKLQEAQAAWLTALNELRQAKDSAKAAERSEQETRSVLEFFKNTLLAAGRPGNVSLPDAFWAAGQGKDVTLRKAVDASEAKVAEAFAQSPLAEASAREMLGLAYLSLGDTAQAVKQYERALALRQAMQGPNAPETAACRNQLAVTYRLAGRAGQGARLFEQNPNSPEHAARPCHRGRNAPLPEKTRRGRTEAARVAEHTSEDST